MDTQLVPELANNKHALAAKEAISKCVHCGFCLATCPTYNLLGDELDSPRGRIYLVKQVLEGHEPTAATQSHLDRCLTCRNCETTCPSGVPYSHLIDSGRALVEERVPRSSFQSAKRKALLTVLPYRKRLAPLLALGRMVRPVLPSGLKASVPVAVPEGVWPEARHARRMLVLEGCAQAAITPQTNTAVARVLDALGISLIAKEKSGCCGAAHHHLNEQDKALRLIKSNIDAWWPDIEAGAEAIITSASGCGVMVKDYAHLLKDDADYAQKAAKVTELTKDIVEVISAEDLTALNQAAASVGKVAFHPPCTLQHGQKLPQVTERLLVKLGFQLTQFDDAHTCCGSAGTYSLFQPEISKKLLRNKLNHLLGSKPDVIVTANVGCQLHLQSGSGLPVKHWIELLDAALARPSGTN